MAALHPVVSKRVGLALVAAIVTWAPPVLAQIDRSWDSTPQKKLCFARRQAANCGMFAVTEFGYARLVGEESQDTPFGEPHIEPHVVMWELGLMRNTDSHTALGGTVLLTSRFSLGLKARYRRWIWRDVSVEFAPGLILYDDRQFARAPAFTGHLLLNLEDVLSVGGMLEVSRFGANTDIGQPPTTITKPFLVVRLGSYPGLVGVVSTGAALGVLALLAKGPTY